MTIEHVVVKEDEFEYWDDEAQEFCNNFPSNFYCVNALSERVFFKTKDRALAQAACDELYGRGKYTVRTVKDQKGSSNVTCKASLNSNSIKGLKKFQIQQRQGFGV